MKNILIAFAILFSFLSVNAQSSVKFKNKDFPIAGFSIMKSSLKGMEYVDYESFLNYNEKENTFELTVVQTFGEPTNLSPDQVEMGAKSRREGSDKDILITQIKAENVATEFLNEENPFSEEVNMFTQTVYSVYVAVKSEKGFKVKMYDRSSPEILDYEQNVGVNVYFKSKEAAQAFFNALLKATQK